MQSIYGLGYLAAEDDSVKDLLSDMLTEDSNKDLVFAATSLFARLGSLYREDLIPYHTYYRAVSEFFDIFKGRISSSAVILDYDRLRPKESD